MGDITVNPNESAVSGNAGTPATTTAATDPATERLSRRTVQAHVGSIQQMAYVRPIRYEEGRAGGMRAFEVKNGPMRFVSMADKALDVSQLEYRGENLTFLSKPGLNGRNPFDTHGAEAQRSIMGGLFFTCGFENIGAPYTDPEGHEYPMHGRIRTTPAEHVSADAHWTDDGEYVISVSGEVREAELFGENLVMRRTITTVVGRPEIVVDDVVTNEGFRDEPLMWMYHCNAGWPLLAEGAQVIIPSRHAEPRNEDAANDTTPWSEIGEPVPNKPESVFIHTLASDPDGRSFAAVMNRKLGLGLSVEFDTADFPYFMQWKSVAAGDYVVGLEPANSSVHGRGYHEKRGDLHTIAPGASEHKRVTFRIHEGAAALDALERRRDALLA
ncbi:aldose 1-epimerase family protein [Bifidobacterium simiarum]|uniref:aldose 1-epimerase family protein n=1 Tax=Bifidobacterium simiarum TaxID=2045441 RepID=UPI001F0B1470|nr:aldose 1-epimerase family protein [Bifidobacterium simiarum]